MAWIPIRYKLQSQAPLIMHNGQTADPLNRFSKAIKKISSKRNKTDADHEEMARLEFLAGLYMGDDGPVIPSHVVDGMLLAAAKKSREGPTCKSGCFCASNAPVQYEGPRNVAELWEDESFRFASIVRVQTARVNRMRPIFRAWEAVITVNIETTLVDVARVDEWVRVAGTQIGVGDWRPQYGRFQAERLTEE